MASLEEGAFARLSPQQRAALETLLSQRRASRPPAEAPEAAPGARILRRSRAGDPAPLSFAQRRLWFIDQLEPGLPLYNMPIALRAEGPLHRGVLARVLGEIVRRHEALRTVFADPNGTPVQVIRPAAPFALPLVDLTGLPAEVREAAAQGLVQDEAARPFDLLRGPLLRGILLRLTPPEEQAQHIVALTLHHIVSDGWSMGILVREITTLYAAFAEGASSPLAELPVQYADFAVWQSSWLRGEVLARELGYWRRQLADLPPVLELPTDRPRPAAQSFRGASKSLWLPPALTRQMQDLGWGEGATLFMVLLAGFQALLARWSGQRDLAVGSPVTGRNRAEIEGLIGFFVNTLVHRGDLAGEPSFRGLLGRVRETALAAFQHQDVPFEKLVEELAPERTLAYASLFQVMLALQNAPAGTLEIRDLRLRRFGDVVTTAKFDLTFYLAEQAGGIAGVIVYSTDLFDATTIDRLTGHFERLLTAALATPELAASGLPLLSPAERHQLQAEWNDTHSPQPLGPTLPERFFAAAARQPQAVALRLGEDVLTYGELARRVHRRAADLSQRSVSPETVTALCFERSFAMVEAVLAVLAAGGAYMALDPRSPARVLTSLLEEAGPGWLLTQEHLLARLPEHNAIEVLTLDAGGWNGGTGRGLPPPPDLRSLAYLAFTSGSTGAPKGILGTHGAVASYLDYLDAVWPLSPEDRVLQLARLSFDASIRDLLYPLSRGASVVLLADSEARDPSALLREIARHGVTCILGAVPSLLHALVEAAISGEDGRNLRLVLASGEPLPLALCQRVRDQFGGVRIANQYGASECSLSSTLYQVPSEASGVGVALAGRPISRMRCRVLDSRLREVPVGVVGQVFLGGIGVTRGYLNGPDLTAGRFLPDPFSSEPGERLYATGDLGRQRSDGALEVLGRLDHQVKVRGNRLELGEVEAVLAAHPEVSRAVATVREGRLVAYVVSRGGPPTASELRLFLTERLPEHAVPSLFIPLEALPLNANGKVDRKALPAPQRQTSTETWLPPRTPVEEVLAGIWAELLNLERVGAADHFFDLGGHSLLATRVMSRLRRIFGVEMPLRALFEAPTLADLAARVEAARRAGTSPIAPSLTPVPRGGPLPLSFAQQRLWFLHQMDPTSPAYNMPFAFWLSGPLAVPALAASLTEVIRRHETLRTTLVLSGDGPVQSIAPPAQQPFPMIDLSALPEDVSTETTLQISREEASRPFDLACPPVVRTLLLQLTEHEHALLFTIHHVSGDAWSLEVLSRDLAELYGAAVEGRPARLTDLPVQYADFAVWQRSWLHGEVLAAQIEYWRRQLVGAPTLLEMPLDRSRPPVQSFRSGRIRVQVAAELTSSLAALGRREGATGFMTLLAGFQALLHRYGGQESVVVGMPIANRGQAELEQLIGFFANTLALRTDFAGDPGFAGLLERVREAALGAYTHQDLPFEKLVDELVPQRDMSHAPIFQAFFVYQNAPRQTTGLRDLSLRPFGADEGVARFDLALVCTETASGLTVHLDYNTGLFEEATASRMLRLFCHLLTQVDAEPQRPIGDLVLLDEEEHRQVVLACNATTRARAREELSLHGLFERQAALTPEAPATVGDNGVVLYRELAGWAGRIAERLAWRGIGAEDRVGVCLERSAAALAALLGTLRSGAAYVPLDPEWPRERLAAVAADAGLAALLTRSGLTVCAGLAPWEVIVEELREGASENLSRVRPVSPEAAAYVIYTSGSTGAAKGVVVPYRAAAHFVLSMGETLGLGPSDRLLLFAPLSFDASVLQIFPALSRGAAVVVHADPREIAGAELIGFCERHGVTVLDLPAALWRQWIEDLATEGRTLPAGIRTFLTGGESVLAERVRTWAGLTHRPAVFLSSYGPTEATVTATVFLTDSGAAASLPSSKVPIGRPLPNVRAYVLDARMHPVPAGVTGELYLAGEGLARGYLGRPELTAASFLPDALSGIGGTGDTGGGRLYRTGDLARRLPGGDLEFAGRADTQVKIRGFRLELAEVEAVLRRHPDLAECVVTVREDQPGDRRLVAYAVPQPGLQPGTAPGVSELRSFVAGQLPRFMVPAAFVLLNALPLLASGKVDRGALPEPESDRPQLDSSYSDPRTPVEKTLAALWAQVLHLDRVGVHDNFFELGGDSILSIQILARANQMGMRLTARQIFEYQTIAELARVAASAPVFTAEQGIVTGAVPLTPIQRWFFAQGFTAAHHFNQAMLLDIAAPLAPSTLERAVAALAGHHDALRMRFPSENGLRQEGSGLEAAVAPLWIDLSALPAAPRNIARVAAQETIQASFDLERGPLTRLAVFDAGAEGRRLLWAAHHLVVDGVSWRVLLEDLETACRLAAEGRPPALPAKTTSFRAWAERLVAHARSGGFQGELPYWIGATAETTARLPVDFPAEGAANTGANTGANTAANTVESALSVNVTLDPEETRALLQTVPATYRTQINDALLAALARAFAAWTGAPALVVDLEGHGREPLFDDVDLSRTVGWFTTQFPIRLDLAGTADPSDTVEALLSVKEQLRQVPGHGIGHGLLVYEGGPEAEPLRTAPPAQVSFNYLGQIGPGAAAETLFRLSGMPAGATRHPRSHRTHLIEVSGVVAGGRLQIGFGYSRSLHRRETIERLAASFQAALRDLIARSRKGFQKLAGLLPENVEDLYPLSPLQQGMLFHSVLEPGTGVYINQSSTRLRGLDPALFRATWQRVVDRHPILRTAFLWEGIEEPVQAVQRHVRLPWQDEDWRGLSAGDQEARLAELRAAERFRSFDLAEAPLLRFLLVRLADDEHELIWTFHHLLLDGWSTPLLLREVLTIQAALRAGQDPELPSAPRFRDYIAWLQRQDLSTTEAFWRRTLAGFREPTPLGIGRPGSQGVGELLEELAQLDSSATAALPALAARHHLTLNTLVLGSWALLLGRYAGKEDVLFGSVVSGRPIDLPGVESMIGMFINTLPVRVAVPGARRLLAWLQEVQAGQIELRQHEHSPLIQVQKWSDLPPGVRMFESLFVFENYPTAPQGAADGPAVGFQIVGTRSMESTGYPLTLAAWGGGALGFRLSYDSARCEPAAAHRLLGHLGSLLSAMATGEDRPLEDLPLLTAGEELQIAAWNDTENDWDLEVCLHALIEQSLDLDPAAVAVTCEGAALTRRELDERANRLAHRLRALGAGPEQRVALFLERSVELMVALLAVLKSGAAYLPLDPDHPADRIAFQAAHARPAALLTQAHLAGRLPALPALDTPVLILSPSGDEVAGESAARPRVHVNPDHPAYVLYTSGSTGRPKGVAVSHRAIVNRLLWMQDAYGLTAADRVLQKTPYSFDVSVWELFWPLMTGARLVVARPGGHRDNAYLAETIVAQRITLLHFVPSMLQLFLEEPGVAECRTLRDVVCSGEALPADLARRFAARLGQTRLHNLYGPTEAAVDVTSWAYEPGSTEEDHGSVPIGRPIANTRIHLLDPGLLPVPVGVPGELWIAGVNLARGYLGRPDLTAERFLPAPIAGKPGEPGERVYRTGDLARRRSDGAIEFLGRLDHQVKIRGFRIELGEIEAALAAHPRVREAVVMARDGLGRGERRLVAYLVADGAAPTVGELQQALGARLPDYMVPAAFVVLESFPLTPSGKVDRKALPEPGTDRPDLEQPFVAPATPEEIAWAEIWKEVLGVDEVGIHDNFFALGGDSIHILRVLARARERGLSATLQQIYQRQTIQRLLEGQEAAPAPPAVLAAEIPPFGLLAPGERERLPAGIEDAYPLALLQTGMLFHSEYSPETAVFHDVFAYHVRSPFDLEALRGAVRELSCRHATLRTSFLLTGPGEPLQLVHQEVEIPVGVTDLRSLAPAEQRAALQAWIAEERRQRFDWARPPLVRIHVHRRSDDSYQLALSFHHALLDGWSIASLFSELFQELNFRLGRGPAPDLALRSTFRDFVALEREALASPEQRELWRRDLAGRTATLLPRWPAPAAPGGRRIRRHPVPLSAEISEGLQRLASSLGVPIKSALLAAHLRVLQLLTGQADLITGLVANGRPEEKDGERVLGLFLNTLPFRLELRGGTWRELVGQTFAAERERLPFRRFPLAEIQRMLGGQPLFEVVFNFVSFHVYARTAGLRELEVLGAEVVEETNFPLGVNFSLDPVSSRLQLGLDWATTELRPEQVEAIAGYYARTLAAMASTPEVRYEEAGLLAPAETQLLVVEANDTQTTGRSSTLCIHRLFEEQAAHDPSKTALILGDQRLTYGELNEQANRLARRLCDVGVGPETVVGLCAERSFEAIAGILGVLKAGGAYLPLDPAYPPERLSFLLEDARVPVLLCQERLLGRLPAHHARVVPLDTIPEELEASNLREGRDGASPLHPAYVIYTSGSTGVPKGVVAPHGGLASFALAMAEQIGLGPSHRFLEFASLSFDASAVQIFPTLLSGAALVLHPDPTGLSSHEILRLCEQQGVTVLDLPAALWRQFVEDVSADGFGSAPLSVFMTGGESVSVARLRKWADAAPPGALFLSSYGPTEATVTTTLFAVTREQVGREQVDGLDGRVIPLGRRLPNVRVHLLDRHLQPVPPGVPGEICIGGAGITRGYLGRPDLTAQAFTPDPFAASEGHPGARLYRTGDMARSLWDGRHLEFLGRFDHQVKVRGFRVEPGEIEAVLAAFPEVAHAAVVIREDTPGDVRLVAYVVSQPEVGIDVRALRNVLQEKLPPHMVPAAFVVLDALPVTAHGKLDRQALPAPEGARLDGDRPYRAPRTPVEQRLAQVWSEVLKVERAGLDDSFFELGGHSLIAVQMIGRLRETFQVDLALRALYDAATLAELAEVIEQILAGGAETAVSPREALPSLIPDPAGRFQPFPLTPVQQAYWIGQSALFELGGAGSNIYTEIEVSGGPRFLVARIKAALPRWIERHDCLRMVVLPDGRQRILEHVPRYVPEVVDLRGLEPWEARDRLEVTRERLRFAQLIAGEWPPFEIVVFKLAGGRLRICVRLSALVVDGTSRRALMEDLYSLVGNLNAPFPVPDISYRDYALAREALRDTETGRRSREAWMKRLPGLPPAPDLPRVREGRIPLRPRFVVRTLELLDAEAWQRLRSRAVRAGLTPTGAVLAAFVDVLSFFAAAPRFTLSLIGTERFPLHPRIGEVLGNFNTIHLLEVDGWEGPFEARARRLRDRLAADQELPFFSGLEALRELNRLHGNRDGATMPVLFNSVLEYDEARDNRPDDTPAQDEDSSVDVRNVELNIYTPQVLFSPTVLVGEDGELLVKWQAVEDAFPPGLIAEMATAFERRLRDLADREESWQAVPEPPPLPAEPEAPERLAPRDAEEEEVAALWRDLLGTGDFGVRDEFFAAGGDSFGVVRLVSGLEERIFAVDPLPRPGLWRRLRNRFGRAEARTRTSAQSLLRERLMAAFIQEPTVENLAAFVRRERAARAAEVAELAPAALPAGLEISMRRYLLLWFSQFVSAVGTGLGSFALGVWIYRQNASVTQFAMFAFVATCTALLVTPLAGVLADRWDRKRLILLGDCGAAVMTGLMAVALYTNQMRLWHVYIVAMVMVGFAALQGPALVAATSTLVPRRQLARVSGMTQAAGIATGLICPPLSGALVPLLGYHGVIAIDITTFLFAFVVLLFIRLPRPTATAESGERHSMLRDFRFGWDYLRQRPGLLSLLWVFAATNFALAIVQVLLTPLILSFGSAANLGFVSTALAAGGLIGSLVLSIWGGPRNRVSGILLFLLLQAPILLLGALQPNVLLIAAAAFAFAALSPLVGGLSQAIWQSKVPHDLQGRVFSMRGLIGSSTAPLALLLAGPLADRVFEPLMAPGGALAGTIGQIIGVGKGRGIGLLFMTLGLFIMIVVLLFSRNPRLRKVESDLPDAAPES